MGLYQVRLGQTLGQNGITYVEGQTVSIPDNVAVQLADKVQSFTLEGQPSAPPTPFELDLAQARAHERISIVEQELTRRRAAVAETERLLALEQERLQNLAGIAPATT